MLFNLRPSSNAAEKSNDIVVADRQKHNGMSWSFDGSGSPAVLKATCKNNTLDLWLKERKISLDLKDAGWEMKTAKGQKKKLCYPKPVHIGFGYWFGAITVCFGVTIGDGCVIGSGFVVTRGGPAYLPVQRGHYFPALTPSYSFAVGVPAKIIRKLSDTDSMKNRLEILGGCMFIG